MKFAPGYFLVMRNKYVSFALSNIEQGQQGVFSENRFLTFVFSVQKNAPGRLIRKKMLTTETILNFVLVFILAN